MTERKREGGRRLHGKSPRDDVARELGFHIDMRAQELIDEGWDSGAARAEALRVFGDYAGIRNDCDEIALRQARTYRRSTMLTELVQDLRYAARWLLRQPAFALMAIMTLALGIGANTAAFTIVNGVLLAPLPYPEPNRLVAVWEESTSGSDVAVAYQNFADWQVESRTLSRIAAWMPAFRTTVLGGAEPARASVARVSGDLFATLEAGALRGRTFIPGSLEPGSPVEVVVSEGFWRSQLGAEPDLSRQRLEVLGDVAQVVGVMPGSFDFPRDAQIWYPLDVVERGDLGTRSSHNFNVVGRLAPGATIAAAEQELTTLIARIRERDQEADAAGANVYDLREDSVGESRRALLILLGASGFVLLVACTNLASALLGRAARREHELAIRSSLGALRVRLIRQLLTESLVLAGLGAVAGLGAGHLLIRAAVALGPDAVPRLAEARLDGWVLAFTSLLAVAAALAFGTAPALRAATIQPFEAMRGRGTLDVRQRRGWSVLVGAEVALAVMLLVGSGLLIRSFYQLLTQVDAGFDTRGQLAVSLSLPVAAYDDAQRRVLFYNQLIERISGLHGVERAALSMTLPLVSFDPFGSFYREGDVEPTGAAHYRIVSPDFFETMGTPIVRGRGFTPADRPAATEVVIINQRMAETYFGDTDPIGSRIMTGGMDMRGDVPATIIGVVGDVRYRTLDAPAAPAYYLPYAQRPDRIMNMTLLVRTTRQPLASSSDVRAAARGLDANVALEISTVDALVAESFAGRRFMLFVLAAFATIALLLAAVGDAARCRSRSSRSRSC